MKTHWRKLKDNKHLGSWDLDDGNGGYKTIEVEIIKVTSITIEGFDGNEKTTPIVHFKGVSKPMIFNSTNGDKMEKITKTPYAEDWIGWLVTLHVLKVKSFKTYVDALRIKSARKPTTQAPTPVKPELTPQHPKWGDAVKSLTTKATTLETILGHFQISDANLEVLKAAIETTNTETPTNTETTE